jgi:DNA invertase Pin-like site-specific DNA recombinase
VETNLTTEVSLSPETRRLLRRIAARGKAFKRDRATAVHQAKAEGASLREIAKELGITHPAVRDIANKPVPNGDED